MSVHAVILLILVGALIVYLAWTLIFPEHFS